ncbi:MAG: hypothetical protein WCX82_00195 [archaeon]|jgi:hypothetical protein
MTLDNRMKLYFQNRKRIVGAVCRHVLKHHGKFNKDLPILKEAVENTITNLLNHKDRALGVDAIIHYDSKSENSSFFIKLISDKVSFEYTKLIKEKHVHLQKLKPKPHTRARIH